MGLIKFFKGIVEETKAEIAAEDALMKEIGEEKFDEIAVYRGSHRIKKYVEVQEQIEYIKYREELINSIDKDRAKSAVFFNRLLLTEDFILNIGHPNIMVKTDDIWGIIVGEPTQAVIKDAIYNVTFLTTNPVIPYFKTKLIINIEYDVKQQFYNFSNVMFSCCKNLRYKQLIPSSDTNKIIYKDKTFSSTQEQNKYAKQAYDADMIFDLDLNNTPEHYKEDRAKLREWLRSLRYEPYTYRQEEKTTERDRSLNLVKKAFKAFDFAAISIGVVTGGMSLDNAIQDWDMRHMN